MIDISKIASWYPEDEDFNPNAEPTPAEQHCVQQVEEKARAERREADFAEVLIALAKMIAAQCPRTHRRR
jgi:hypothetical protein